VGIHTNQPSHYDLPLGDLVGWGQSGYPTWNSPAVTDEFGETSLWLFPTSGSETYTFTAIPPEDTPFATFNVYDITVSGDKIVIMVLEFVHPPPVTTATLVDDPYPSGEFPDPTTVSLSATAAPGYWVESTYYSIDGGGQQLYVLPFTVAGAGEHTIIYWSIDNYGVYEVPKTRNFAIITNQPPVADAGESYTAYEGDTLPLDASGSLDPDGVIVSYEWDLDGDGEYDDASGVMVDVYFGDNGTYTVGLRVTDDKDASATAAATVMVENVPPFVVVDSPTQAVQYSDLITDVTITATDVAADNLSCTATGLPDDLTLTPDGCSDSDGTNGCTWTLAGVVDVPEGTYDVAVSVADKDGDQTVTIISIVVTPEDATVVFDGDNPVAVGVVAPGADSEPFTLVAYVTETQPDLPAGSGAPGDIGHAQVAMSLVPVGPGSTTSPRECTPLVQESGYDSDLAVSCAFDQVPVNTYTVQVTVSGGYYAGSGEDVLSVYDPSLGFTTGGGWFYWPGNDDRTNFGFNVKYLKKGNRVQGSLLLIRHLDDGSIYRVKSNAMYGLAIGELGGSGGWATLNGKATYLEPGWVEPVGNQEFIAYVEDWGEPGYFVDRLWIQVMDKNGIVIPVMSLVQPASGNARAIEGGNIVVPH
jgi:hypothetical protein